MNDIDSYLTQLREEQEVDEFVNKGLYPERLNFKYSPPLYLPKMEENEVNNKLHTITPFDSSLYENMEQITETLNRVERELKTTMERENTELNNTNKEEKCPICMDSMGERNYIVPVCGHKVCMKCFVTNITSNCETGCLCSLCRAKIV
tara:strand:- start:1453 stop:1899 length:447 start_codon:yes stop_codon:yes gene_type:complete